MRMEFSWLPMATPLDPAEEPPGSLDPLGTLAHAERLSDALLAGFTARMWRCRFLTFAVITAAVADRTVELMGGRENIRLEARLAFERLFVSAIVQMADRDPLTYANAPRALAGRNRAKRALMEGEPLTAANFLKGQAVNGPFGVIARLARDLELIDDEGRLGRNAVSVLTAWSDDEQLPGFFDEENVTGRAGAAWMNEVVKRTAASVSHGDWPGGSHRIWELLARHMRPDRIGMKERRVLLQLLNAATVRQRMIELLKDRVEIYRQATNETDDRGKLERVVLLRGVRPELRDEPTDRSIRAVIEAVDAYEQGSGFFQQAFEGIIWGLKFHGGRSRPAVLLVDDRVRRHLEKTLTGIGRLIARVDRSVDGLRREPSTDATQLTEPILRLREDLIAASASVISLADGVLGRHERVQKEKGKAPWIEREAYWTLMPGENRVSIDSPPVFAETYLHPFKIPNAYFMLNDLRQVAIEVRDVAEQS